MMVGTSMLAIVLDAVAAVGDVAGKVRGHMHTFGVTAGLFWATLLSLLGLAEATVIRRHVAVLRDLFEEFCTCFNDADMVVVSDVHPAGEAPIEGVDRDALIQGLRTHGHRQVTALEDPSDLAGVIHDIATAGDVVICLGAGSITGWAHELPDGLRALSVNQTETKP